MSPALRPFSNHGGTSGIVSKRAASVMLTHDGNRKELEKTIRNTSILFPGKTRRRKFENGLPLSHFWPSYRGTSKS